MIYFIHIPKTGGVAIRHFLQQHASKDTYWESSLYDNSFLSTDQMMNINKPWAYDFYMDHKLSLWLVSLGNNKGFSIVRNPIDRFLSFYNFTNSNMKADFFKDDIRDAIKDWFVQENAPPKLRSQIHHLSHGYGFNLIRNQVEKYGKLLVPYEFIDDIPLIFHSRLKLEHHNITEEALVTNLAPETRIYLETKMDGDLFLHSWVTEYYLAHRAEIIENWLQNP